MDGRLAVLSEPEDGERERTEAITVCPHCLSVLVFRIMDGGDWYLDVPTQAEWQCIVRLDIIGPAITAISMFRRMHTCEHDEQVEPDWVKLMARLSR